MLVLADQLEAPFSDVPNPFPLAAAGARSTSVEALAWLSVFASLFVGAAATRTRYRRSEGIERLQLLWLAYAAMLIPLGVVCFLLWGLVIGEPGDAVVRLSARNGGGGGDRGRRRRDALPAVRDRSADQPHARLRASSTAALGLLYAVVSLLAGVARRPRFDLG